MLETLLLKIPPSLWQFLRFGVVGSLGLVVDCACVLSLRPFLGLTAATLCAYFVAATGNWLLNRLWTFRETSNQHHLFIQWLKFLGANSLGFCLNRGAVFSLYAVSPLTRHYPVLALAVGSGCGLIANFTLSRRLVFKQTETTTIAAAEARIPQEQKIRPH
ncbi:GtrA family protein [Neokomagataea tanensis]|uniref:GtrA family protein n=1 Tax=Neokomagataea tanensis TaxID=661191 RepID=A0A4Y6V8K3_9PROT|nr:MULTISPECIES: GtrA family protein [Neokomagataea]QDH24807.1 GtrA family protein [Neokomagataea tanensis]